MIRKLRFANINKDRLVNSMNKEDYSLFSTKGTGKVRAYIKPIISVTGEELLNSLLIRGEYAGYDTHFSDGEILKI